MALVRLRAGGGHTCRQAAAALGFGRRWGRKWWRRYRQGGDAALAPPRPAAAGPLATFAPAVRAAVPAYRREHPLQGARRAHAALCHDPALAGQRLPTWRTLHRGWAAAGLLPARAPRTRAPDDEPAPPGAGPHAVWQLDHQDGVAVAGLAGPVVLQDVRAPACGLTIGADAFAEPRGGHALSDDALLGALRRRFAQWGLPDAIQVDRGVRFLGQSQRAFPSRFELYCAGMGIGVLQIRPRRPTDNGAGERLHRTIDGAVAGPRFPDVAALQASLDAHVRLLNERFPSRAAGCGGRPPLEAHPEARHSGRPYDPAREPELFDPARVDRALAGWRWYRRVGPRSGQLSFAHRNVSVGPALRGHVVALRFDPADRRVVAYRLGAAADDLGPELTRFHCPAFDPAAIRGAPAAPEPGPQPRHIP